MGSRAAAASHARRQCRCCACDILSSCSNAARRVARGARTQVAAHAQYGLLFVRQAAPGHLRRRLSCDITRVSEQHVGMQAARTARRSWPSREAQNMRWQTRATCGARAPDLVTWCAVRCCGGRKTARGAAVKPRQTKHPATRIVADVTSWGNICFVTHNRQVICFHP